MKGRVSSSMCAAGMLSLCTVAFAQQAGSLAARRRHCSRRGDHGDRLHPA